ncbi:LOW QUALITY PROTEIN: carbohydrate sulfotransferase 12-like [Pecten maximus]|uniref:LOW QUALITY PROTEIN: carbohydrate sulfotransferase 12-like n=1 Tax=Pecten maximus TaxID=6579 RepID=UPI00145837A6|nr:LOW QUALITY PROTEIN: carbohydrate sulfotransferase 12-like [Pecten maximus]
MVKCLLKYLYATCISIILLIELILIKVLLMDRPENNLSKAEIRDGTKVGHVLQSRILEISPHENNSLHPGMIYTARRERMLKACAALGTRSNSTSYVRNNVIIDRPLGIAYCPVEKIASTFWRRTMRIVVGQSRAKSPFAKSVKAFDAFYTLRSLEDSMIDRFMKKSLTFMFVRDPYSRLFSAYVDKLVSPNCDYWKGTGAFGIRLFRNNAKEVDKKCGHDITFREFVKTVIYFEEHEPFSKRNVHFTPTFEHCDPCRYQWHLIGKLETFTSDVFHILDRMSRADIKRSLEINFKAQYLHYTIRDQCNWLFHFRKHYITDCNITFSSGPKTTMETITDPWYHQKTIDLSHLGSTEESIKKHELIQVVYNAMGDASDRSEAVRNRKDAFLEAYSTVDMDDLIKLSKIFRVDCELFGYDCKPDRLFDMRRTVSKQSFFA